MPGIGAPTRRPDTDTAAAGHHPLAVLGQEAGPGMTDQPRVLALDLSMRSTGVALPNGDLDTIRTVPSQGDGRLSRINLAVYDLITCNMPHLVVIEDLPMGIRNAAGGPLGMVHGIVRLRCMNSSVPYLLVPPATLKTYACGKGNARKPDLRVSLLRRTGIDVDDEDQCDAAWLRLLGLDLLGHPVLDLPATHRRALTKLTLPEGAPTP